MIQPPSLPSATDETTVRKDPARGPAWRAVLSALLILLYAAQPAFAQGEDVEPGTEEEAQQAESAEADAGDRLPPARMTRHRIRFDDEAIRFQATAGAVTLTGEQDRPEADIAFIAYTLETEEPAARPVTFAVNGGPGAASAYLHLGALGPWVLPMEGDRIAPSQRIEPVENPQSWLPFTDLVFIDPVGTGFSRLVEPTSQLRNRYLSIDGDIGALARFITRWLSDNGRLSSPKYFVGESYGGFRGPLLAEALQTEHGIALKGLVLLSPVLDFGWWAQPDYSPMPLISRLPSLAAAAMEERGTFSEDALAEAEDYAAGRFVTDLLRGVQDEAALERLAERVSALTGLPREVVRDHDGRIDMETFTRELLREEGRVASPYDTTINADAPVRGRNRVRAADPVLDAMTAPLTTDMLALYRDTLKWLPDRSYQLLNGGVSRAWNWGRGRGQPEAVTALRRVLALDPHFRLLVVHGYTDLVTPYFATTLILRQLRAFEPEGRVRQENYRGGHMFYTREASRRAFRDDARALYEASGER